MSIEERDDLNPEPDPGYRRETEEDVEGHASKFRAVDDPEAEDGDDDVEGHASKRL
jgi:hypothetical protein